MNSHTVENYNKPHAAGFNGSDFLLDPHTYSYYNATFQRNHDPPVSYPGKYSTDIAKNKSLGFLEEALSSDRPFFLAAAPVGPHTNIDANTPIKNGSIFMQPPIPADRHKHLFKGVKAPRTKNFNPDKVGIHLIDTLWLTLLINIHHSLAEQAGSANCPNKTKQSSTITTTSTVPACKLSKRSMNSSTHSSRAWKKAAKPTTPT